MTAVVRGNDVLLASLIRRPRVLKRWPPHDFTQSKVTLVKTAACIAWPTCPTAAFGLQPPNAHRCHQLQTNALGLDANGGEGQFERECDFSAFVLFILGEGVSAHTPLSLAASKLGAELRWCVC